jgi:hypothetical protein
VIEPNSLTEKDKVIMNIPFAWMSHEGWDHYRAVCILAEAEYACLVAGNRDGWLILSHALRHISRGTN